MAIDCARWIREIGRGPKGSRDLDRGTARELLTAVLDGAVPELELGAILVAMRVKGESLDETLGFLDALATHVGRLAAPVERSRPVVLASYNGARRGANLTPLVALLLARYGVPVLVHGLAGAGTDDADGGDAEGEDAPDAAAFGRVTTAEILRELGVPASATLDDAQARLDRGGVAYLPTSVLAPALADLLARRARLGVRSFGHSLVKLVDPFAGDAVRVVSVSHPDYLVRMREAIAATRADALLMRGTEGEPYANPKRCPRLELHLGGALARVVEAEEGTVGAPPPLPGSNDVAATTAWIAGALEGTQPVPAPLLAQLGLLLEATREPAGAQSAGSS